MSALLIISVKCEKCPRHLDVRLSESVIGETTTFHKLLAETRVNVRHSGGWTKTPDGDFCPDHAR